MNEEKDIDWCEEKKLAIMNTWFASHPRRRYADPVTVQESRLTT